ncbi:MAG: dephospho-CoA kinase [Epsilonproteobacteria bacterium]|nr:dephospho-CoA kinase [Campylobacterota bacterium]
MVELNYAVVLTGGIATGKSTTANLLKLYGFHIIDADKIAHQVLNEQFLEIKKMFGEEYVKDDEVDRKALGKLVFSNPSKRKQLETLLHPLIKEKIYSLAQKQEKFKIPYFIDIPLFFETKNYPLSPVVVVYAPKEIQLQRLIKRNHFTPQEALQRINSQIDIEEKRKLANYVIDNSQDLKHLQNEVENLIEKLKERYAFG